VRERSGRSWAEHADIVAAIAARDERAAFARACAHIANARAAYFDGAEAP
jgi:DNA-binding GntR family transcriptional regulator